MQDIAQYADGSGYSNPQSYMKNATVIQLGRNHAKGEASATTSTTPAAGTTTQNKNNDTKGSNLSSYEGKGLSEIAHYTFFSIFPTNISAIELNYESTNVIEEFQVEMQVNYWYPSKLQDNKNNNNPVGAGTT